MEIGIVVVGIVAQAAAMRLVALGRTDAWRTMGGSYVVLIPLTLSTGEIVWTHTASSSVIGAVAGILLFAATRAFVVAAERWSEFEADVRRLYTQRSALPLGVEVGIGALVALGEELFWRGLVIAVLVAPLGLRGAAVASWALFVATNLVSRSRAFVVGALVGGGVWTALAVIPAAGLAAAVVCHVTWTVLMLLLPPRNLSRAGRRSAPVG